MAKYRHPLYRPRSRKFKIISSIIFIAAVAVLLAGALVSLNSWHQNQIAAKKASAAVAAANKGSTSNAPSTTPVTAKIFNSYSVPANQPKYIFIPKLGMSAIIVNLGITESKQIAAPNNVYKAGWYNQSGLPGQLGAMLIDGHVASWTSHGVFYGIRKLNPGDVITIERGDGTKFNYTVIRSQVYPSGNVNVDSLLNSVDPSKPGLNLITCTGDVISGTNEYSERIAIYAVQN